LATVTLLVFMNVKVESVMKRRKLKSLGQEVRHRFRARFVKLTDKPGYKRGAVAIILSNVKVRPDADRVAARLSFTWSIRFQRLGKLAPGQWIEFEARVARVEKGYDGPDWLRRIENPSKVEWRLTQDILHTILQGYRNIELTPPWEKRIVLVAGRNYPIHVFDGDVNDTQRFLGAYRYSGVVDEQEVQALRRDSRVVVECSGVFSCQPAPAGFPAPFLKRLDGRMKDYWSGGAFILLTEGEQNGDFEFAWEGGEGTLANVGEEEADPIYRITASSPETFALLKARVQDLNGGRPFVEDNSEAGVLETLLRMSDDELQRMNGHRIRGTSAFDGASERSAPRGLSP